MIRGEGNYAGNIKKLYHINSNGFINFSASGKWLFERSFTEGLIFK